MSGVAGGPVDVTLVEPSGTVVVVAVCVAGKVDVDMDVEVAVIVVLVGTVVVTKYDVDVPRTVVGKAVVTVSEVVDVPVE